MISSPLRLSSIDLFLSSFPVISDCLENFFVCFLCLARFLLTTNMVERGQGGEAGFKNDWPVGEV